MIHGSMLRQWALPALAAACLLPSATQAADGTLRFTGEIVGAPYEMHAIDAHPATLGLQVRTGRATRIRFVRQQADRPSASVRVDALDGQPLDIVFADAQGTTTQLARQAEQAIGQDGGVLSIGPGGPRAVSAALVTVRYD